MKELILKVDGMRCGCCESHVNDAVRKACSVKSVKSSHVKSQTVIVCDDVDSQAIINAITKQGYVVSDCQVKPYERKGLFGFLHRK